MIETLDIPAVLGKGFKLEAKKTALMIYGKKKGDKKFKPMDYKAGKFVGNVIHATMWDMDRKKEVQKMVDYMNKENPDYEFTMRRK